MPPITVYRFQYFDRDSEQFKESEDYATEKAILEMGATLLADTARNVEARWVSHSGIVMRTLPY